MTPARTPSGIPLPRSRSHDRPDSLAGRATTADRQSWRRLAVIFVVMLACRPVFAPAQAPFIDPVSDPDHFGPTNSMMFWTPAQKVAGFRNTDRLFATRTIPAGPAVRRLLVDPVELQDLSIRVDGDWLGLDDYLRRNDVAGLLVIQDGAIVFEHYALGNNADTRWISFSVTKSIVSMLVGAAVRDGHIASLDRPIDAWLPALDGTAYEGVTLRHLLQMAAGVEWNEDYLNPEADVNVYPWYDLNLLTQFLGDKPRVAPPGRRFNYNSADIELLGAILRDAVGTNLSEYLARTIWQPFGMESDATWLVTAPDGVEVTGCCISATLRDYGRFGLFALEGARLPDGRRVVPDDWLEAATAPSPASDEYGYLWWLQPDSFEARGVFGQAVRIYPEHDIVIAKQAAGATAWSDQAHALDAILFDTIVHRLTTDPVN